MQPNSDQHQRGLQVPSRQDGAAPPPTSRQAAANLMREQIDTIYDDPQPNEVSAHIAIDDETGAVTHQHSPATVNPYTQTHDETEDMHAAEQDPAVQAHWQKYHSAWQQYYQMYYERYYQAQVQKHVLETADMPAQSDTHTTTELTEDQAVGELRSELLTKVKEQTKKIRSSRHFMPAIVAACVAAIFIFLQYNQIIFANVMAFTTPAASDAVATYVDSNTDVTVGPEPLITIPKLAVKAPVLYDLTTLDEAVVESKLESGTVHYPIKGANSVPGEVGNTVILGHSANDVFAAGNYKFVFLRLEQLQTGDTFYLNYNSKRYTYVVTGKKVISPSQVSELALSTDKPIATLVTCVPVGTSTNRLLVFGEQVAPDPTKATTGSTQTTTNTEQIGGGSKSFFERLFGG